MKLPHSFLIAGIILFIAPGIDAQDLLLVHGKKLRTIQSGSFVQIELPKQKVEPCKRCPLNLITGKLIEVTSDSIVIQVLESNENMVNQNENIGYNFKKYISEKEGPITYISKDDILSIVLKGKKNIYSKHPLDEAG